MHASGKSLATNFKNLGVYSNDLHNVAAYARNITLHQARYVGTSSVAADLTSAQIIQNIGVGLQGLELKQRKAVLILTGCFAHIRRGGLKGNRQYIPEQER